MKRQLSTLSPLENVKVLKTPREWQNIDARNSDFAEKTALR
jgi:hypothetical protein